MANLIQHKRSLTTSIPTSLANGELAFTSNGNILYIGANAAIVAIAGKRFPGVATANQATVLNANGFIDKTYTNKIIVGADDATNNIQSYSIFANSTQLGGSSGASNTEIVSSWAIKTYVDYKAAAAPGSNTQIYFNDSGVSNSSGGFAFDKTTNTISIGNSTINSTANSTTISFNGTASLNSTTYAGTANNALYLGGIVAANYPTLAANNIFTGNNTIGGTTTTMSSNLAFTGANAHFGSAVMVARDLTLSGNLTVQGALTTISATNLEVTDPLIKLATQQTTDDSLDIGMYGVYGNSTVTQYSGIFRDQDNSAIWTVFNTQKAPDTTVDTANVTYGIGTILSYLKSGGLTSNSTVVNITANSTLSVALVANTLTLTTPLAMAYGGVGTGTVTAGDTLVANSTAWTKLALGTTGKVMQSDGSTVVFSDLDGGSF